MNAPTGWKLVPVERLKAALGVVEATMQDAYERCWAECCARQTNDGNCCGNSIQTWAPEDSKIMDALAPAQRALSELLAAAPQPPGEAVSCEWTSSDDPDMGWWETSCGEAWTFIDGGPAENKMKFCPYCGKPLLPAPEKK